MNAKLFIAIISFIILSALYACVQSIRYGTISTWWNSSKGDCTAILPMNIYVVYNEDTEKYAVKVNGNRYLWSGRGFFISDAFQPWTTFGDSCRAKSFAIQYIRQEDEERKNNSGFK